jgi:hypothetical protein
MTSYLKVVLPVAGAMALLASPVLARTAHHYHGVHAPDLVYGRVLVAPPHAYVTPYGADVPQPAHAPSVNPDFQVPGNNH